MGPTTGSKGEFLKKMCRKGSGEPRKVHPIGSVGGKGGHMTGKSTELGADFLLPRGSPADRKAPILVEGDG